MLKSRDITLSTKVYLWVKAMVFPVVMCGYERWTIKKDEGWRIDAFELWCWRRLLRVPWTARRSNQSILKEISPEYSLEGLMLKLKLQYFGHLMRRADSFEKTLTLGKIEGGRRRGWQRMRWLDGITDSMDSMDMSLGKPRSWWWTGRPGLLQSMGSQRVGHDWATELKQITSLFYHCRYFRHVNMPSYDYKHHPHLTVDIVKWLNESPRDVGKSVCDFQETIKNSWCKPFLASFLCSLAEIWPAN